MKWCSLTGVGTLGDGVFWHDADGKFQHISKGTRIVVRLCPCVVFGSRGKSLGRDRWRRSEPDQKEDFHHARRHASKMSAQSISEDAQGGLWTAFNAFGASYWIANSTQDFTLGQHKGAWTVLVDRQQQIWAGTQVEGLFLFQTNHFAPAPGAEIPGPKIFALFEGRNGQLWVGTPGGLARWNGIDWKTFTTPGGSIVRAIAQDGAGNFWLGTENRGLVSFFQGRKTLFPIPQRKTDCRAMIFPWPLYNGPERRFSGLELLGMVWRGFKMENGKKLFHTQWPRQ